MNVSKGHRQGPTPLVRRPHPLRDNIEGLLTVLVLVLTIRHFVFEVFVIPTGSMAPTLMGQHRDLLCPNCGLPFAVDAAEFSYGKARIVEAVCPNCSHVIPEEIVRNTFSTSFPSWPRRLFWRGSNRVIVNKFLCRHCPPKRWDVIVFRYPGKSIFCRSCGNWTPNVPREHENRCPNCGSTDVKVERKNYIKRLIGLPGEKIEIRHGDIYVDGELQRKPHLVQDGLWRLVLDDKYPSRDPVRGDEARWAVESGAFRRDKTARVARLVPDEGQPALVRYGKPIRDFIPYNGQQNVFREFEGDLRWDVHVTLGGPGTLRLNIEEDEQRYSAEVPFGGSGKCSFTLDGEPLTQSDFSCDLSREYHVQFSNADNRLELRVDRRLVLAHEFRIPLGDVPLYTWQSGASIGVSGSVAEFSRIRLERDLNYRNAQQADVDYYLAGTGHVFQVPEDHYFVLGDNTQNSLDGRYWGFLPAENLLGNAMVIWWPLNRLRIVR